ncbi:MAG: ABC transporter ATP-binding protein, partial [Clostridia bacterium]|nr:ABC transporter ATP-binding protein [Clostridia bacterium]
MIRLFDLRKTYKTRHETLEVLKGITLTVPDRKFVMLLGESGSGKSTLANILGLLDTPTSGEYWLDEVPIHTLTSKARTDLRREKVSFVFQSFNLIPTMTARENIELP